MLFEFVCKVFFFSCFSTAAAQTDGITRELFQEVFLEQCPFGWTKFQSKCYRFHNESSGANFHDAFSTCHHAHRSTMLTIHSQEEMEFVRNFTQITRFSVWLGMMRGLDSENDSFTWLDRTNMSYTNWGKNEPKHGGEKRRFCAVISMKNDSIGQWYDVKCQLHYMTVCQMHIQTPETSEIDDIELRIDMIEQRSHRNRQFIILFYLLFLLFLIVYFIFQFISFDNIRRKIVNHRVFLQNVPNSDTVPFIEKVWIAFTQTKHHFL